MNSILVYKLIIEETVKLCARLRTFCAPPEPCALCFVKRTEQNRYACILNLQKLLRKNLDILEDDLVFPCAFC